MRAPISVERLANVDKLRNRIERRYAKSAPGRTVKAGTLIQHGEKRGSYYVLAKTPSNTEQ